MAPAPAGDIAQLTCWLDVPLTVAENCSVWPTPKDAVAGVTATDTVELPELTEYFPVAPLKLNTADPPPGFSVTGEDSVRF